MWVWFCRCLHVQRESTVNFSWDGVAGESLGVSVSAVAVPCVSVELVVRDSVRGQSSRMVVVGAAAFLW